MPPRAALPRRRPEDVRQDRDFWAVLLALREGAGGVPGGGLPPDGAGGLPLHSAGGLPPDAVGGLPPHSAGGFRNRRFAIVRDAAWITLYRAMLPYPQIGVFLRCTGPAGEAFFALADEARGRIEARLRAGLGPGADLGWGSSHHPGRIDVAAVIAAPCPWDDAAAGLHTAWLLRTGALWWECFARLGIGAVAEA